MRKHKLRIVRRKRAGDSVWSVKWIDDEGKRHTYHLMACGAAEKSLANRIGQRAVKEQREQPPEGP
jgi:hypothetical protein